MINFTSFDKLFIFQEFCHFWLQVVYEFDIEPLKEDSQEGGEGRNEVVLQTEKLIGEIRNITNKTGDKDGTEVKENLMDIVKQNMKNR